ncbi:glutamate--tRNA ligase family protein, partial [Pseudoalteromonas sp. SIMBA_153]
RPFYDWVIEKIGFDVPPHQYEFSRLNVDHTLTSKRKLKQLVDEGIVSGWNDPRMPTVAGMRRRGYTPEGLRDFCERVGVTKADSVV